MVWIGGFGFAFWPRWIAPLAWKPRPTRWNAVTLVHVGPLMLSWGSVV